MKKNGWIIVGIIFGLLIIAVFTYLLFTRDTGKDLENHENSSISANQALEIATMSFQNLLVGYEYEISFDEETNNRYVYIAMNGNEVLAKCEVDKYTSEAYMYNYIMPPSGGYDR